MRTRRVWLNYVAAMTTLWLFIWPWVNGLSYTIIAIWEGLMVVTWITFWYLTTYAKGAYKGAHK